MFVCLWCNDLILVDKGQLVVLEQNGLIEVNVETFKANFPKIMAKSNGVNPLSGDFDKMPVYWRYSPVLERSSHFAAAMPHNLRAKAKGCMVYSILLLIFIDDVSENRSKQWNKHHSVYLSNGAVPRDKLENEFHVRFTGTSSFATPLELMQGVRSSIESVVFIVWRNHT